MMLYISLGLTIFDNFLCQQNYLSFLTWVSILCHFGAYYLHKMKASEAYHVRAAMAIPILLMQLNMITVYNALFITFLLPTFLYDLVLISDTKIHIGLTLAHTLLVTVLIRFNLFNPTQNGYECIGSLSSLSYFPIFIIVVIADILLFYYFENIINSNLLISVTKTGRGKTIDAFGRISRNSKNPKNLSITVDSLYEDSCALDSPDAMSALSQTPKDKNTTMQITKPQSFEDISMTMSPKSVDNKFENAVTYDKYKNYITKKFGKDAKEVLSMYNETKHLKDILKILESQSNEISIQFQNQIQSLADEIMNANNDTNPQMIAFKKMMMGKSIQKYFKFLGIENILKIQCKNLESMDE